MEYMRRTAG